MNTNRVEQLEALFRRKPRRWLMMMPSDAAIATLRARGMAILERGDDSVKFYRFEPGMKVEVEPALPWD